MTPFLAGPPHRHDPFRAPVWRHLRAAYLIDRGRRPTRRDDRWVTLAWRHLRWLSQAKPPEPSKELGDVHHAWSLRHSEAIHR
jgi:hypothetical protein